MSYLAREGSVYGGAPIELYHFKRRAECYFYTLADEDVVYNADTYLAKMIERGEIEASNETTSVTVDVTLARTAKLAQVFVRGIPPTPVSLTVWRLHRDDPEAITIFQGEVASVSLEAGTVTLHCVSAQQALLKKLPRIVTQRMCNHALYDAGCGLDPEDFKWPGTITAVTLTSTAVQLTIPNFALLGSNYFGTGFLRVDGTDERTFIRAQAGELVEVMTLVPGLIVGAAVTGYAGCDRLVTTCNQKFFNLSNFMGFPFMPERNPFTQLDDATSGG